LKNLFSKNSAEFSAESDYPRKKCTKNWPQVGRIFAHWAVVYSDQFWGKVAEIAQIFGLLFFHGKSYVSILILLKMGWVVIWATFSPTHLVTLKITKDLCEQ
jgi:hypothetical protein